MNCSEENKASWRYSNKVVRMPKVTAEEFSPRSSCRFPPINKLPNEALHHKKRPLCTESDWFKVELKKEEIVRNKIKKTYDTYRQGRYGGPWFLSLSSDKTIDKNVFDGSSINSALYGDNLRAKDLRVRMYELSEKSRTYKHCNPFSLKALSYDFDGFPKYFLSNYNGKINYKKHLKKRYIQLNEKMLLIDKDLPFCSFKHDPYHWRLSERLKNKLHEQSDQKLKRKIKTPKISGIPKVKKKAATIAKNPFKSNSERNFEKNWLKKYSPRVKLDKKFEKDTKKVVIEKIKNEEKIQEEKHDQNIVKVIEKNFKIDSTSMTSRSFLLTYSGKCTENKNSNETIDSSTSMTLSETFREADLLQTKITCLDKSSNTDFSDADAKEKEYFTKISETLTGDPDPDIDYEKVLDQPKTELNKVQRRNPEEFSISKLKESMVKSSCEIVKSDKFSKHEGCIKVKNFEKAKIESLHDDFISISSETEFKKEVSKTVHQKKIEKIIETHDSTALEIPKDIQRHEKRLPSPKILEKNTKKTSVKSKRKSRKTLVQVVEIKEPKTENDQVSRWADNQAKLLALKRKRKAQERYDKMNENRKSTLNNLEFSENQEESQNFCSFLEPYCIVDPELVEYYERVFKQHDNNKDGYLESFEALLAIDYIIPDIDDAHIEYIYRILELSNLPVYSGRMNQNLFNIVLSLSKKIESLEGFMKGMLNNMDFQSLDWKFYHGKRLFQRLVDNDLDETMSIDCLLFEIEAGLLSKFDNKQIRKELSKFSHFNILDFLTYLPLFTYIHDHIVHQPFNAFTR